jgi:hypothetical protein
VKLTRFWRSNAAPTGPVEDTIRDLEKFGVPPPDAQADRDAADESAAGGDAVLGRALRDRRETRARLAALRAELLREQLRLADINAAVRARSHPRH